MNRLTHFFRRLHNFLGLIVGAQVVLWVASGLYFSLRPIAEVRGDHLRSEAHAMFAELPESDAPVGGILAALGEPVMALKVKPWLGRPVWEVETHSGKVMFDYVSGQPLSPVSEADARRVAQAAWAGEGALAGVTLVDEAPPEAGRGAGRAMPVFPPNGLLPGRGAPGFGAGRVAGRGPAGAEDVGAEDVGVGPVVAAAPAAGSA